MLNPAWVLWLIGPSYTSHLKGLCCSAVLTWKEAPLFETGIESIVKKGFDLFFSQYLRLPSPQKKKRNPPLFIYFSCSGSERCPVSPPAFRKQAAIFLIRAVKFDSERQMTIAPF